MMDGYAIDIFGTQIWYDLESYEYNSNNCYGIRCKKYTMFVRPHREDGPAIIYTDGYEQYRIKGKRQREDGPASIHPNGRIYWCIDDKQFSFYHWCIELNKSEEEITFLKIKWNIICVII